MGQSRHRCIQREFNNLRWVGDGDGDSIWDHAIFGDGDGSRAFGNASDSAGVFINGSNVGVGRSVFDTGFGAVDVRGCANSDSKCVSAFWEGDLLFWCGWFGRNGRGAFRVDVEVVEIWAFFDEVFDL